MLFFGSASRAADALNAISTFFHDAASAHRDIWVERGFDDIGAEAFVFLTVGVAEEVETADFVRAI